MILCIFASLRKHTGPTVYVKSISITQTVSSFKMEGVFCSCKQFPLTLGYAVTIHRSQEIILDKVIVDVGNKECQVGLTYIAH